MDEKEQNNANPPRQRGAQPGNQNAFKHGFYAKGYRKRDLEDLQSDQGKGLEDEIGLVKVAMRRCLEAVMENEPEEIDKWTGLLTTLTLAASRLAVLVRAQHSLDARQDSAMLMARLVSKALTESYKEMGL